MTYILYYSYIHRVLSIHLITNLAKSFQEIWNVSQPNKPIFFPFIVDWAKEKTYFFKHNNELLITFQTITNN